jgi:hypothetical protein
MAVAVREDKEEDKRRESKIEIDSIKDERQK